MKYIVKEIKDEVTREQAIANAQEVFNKIKIDLNKQLPVAIIYGITYEKRSIYFETPIVCANDKDLEFKTNKLKEHYPKSTILVLYKSHLNNDSKKKVNDYELEYKDLPITVWGKNTTYFTDPADYDDAEIEINWTYNVDEDSIIDFFYDYVDNFEEFKDIEYEQVEDYVKAHFKELCKKYHNDLLEYFIDDAISDAEKNYVYEDDEW